MTSLFLARLAAGALISVSASVAVSQTTTLVATEMMPAMNGYLEMMVETQTDPALGQSETMWEITDCATGNALSVVVSKTDASGVLFDFSDDQRRLRNVSIVTGQFVPLPAIEKSMTELGADVTQRVDDAFEAQCALRGTGQLGGELN